MLHAPFAGAVGNLLLLYSWDDEIAAVIAGFASLMFGKGGLLPALVGIAAGFLNLLAAIVVSKMQ